MIIGIPRWVKDLTAQYGTYKRDEIRKLDELKHRLTRYHVSNPLLSIVLIAFNEEQHLLRSIASIANQDYTGEMEFIVVNNNSTDATQEILDRLGVRSVFKLEPGAGSARQAGLEAAKGRFIVFGDADTVYPTSWAREHFENIRKNNVSCSYGRYSFIPSDGKHRLKFFLWEVFKDLGNDFKKIKRPEFCVFGCSFAVKRDWALQEGFKTDLARGEDGYMAYKMKKYGDLVMLTSDSSRPFTDTAGMQINNQSLIKIAFKRLGRDIKQLNIFFKAQSGDYHHRDKNLIRSEE